MVPPQEVDGGRGRESAKGKAHDVQMDTGIYRMRFNFSWVDTDIRRHDRTFFFFVCTLLQ